MKPLATSDRPIRVFISSTFRDMQAERDELVRRIFPQLRKFCEQRGVTWGEVDLRWGIADEQKAEGKALPICLAEIAGGRPIDAYRPVLDAVGDAGHTADVAAVLLECGYPRESLVLSERLVASQGRGAAVRTRQAELRGRGWLR